MYYPLVIVSVYIFAISQGKGLFFYFFYTVQIVTVLKINLMWIWSDLQNTTLATIITHHSKKINYNDMKISVWKWLKGWADSEASWCSSHFDKG